MIDELVVTLQRAEHAPLSREADARILARSTAELSPSRKVLHFGALAVAAACAALFISMANIPRSHVDGADDAGTIGVHAAELDAAAWDGAAASLDAQGGPDVLP